MHTPLSPITVMYWLVSETGYHIVNNEGDDQVAKDVEQRANLRR